jgi:hypothetical protein
MTKCRHCGNYVYKGHRYKPCPFCGLPMRYDEVTSFMAFNPQEITTQHHHKPKRRKP